MGLVLGMIMTILSLSNSTGSEVIFCWLCEMVTLMPGTVSFLTVVFLLDIIFT